MPLDRWKSMTIRESLHDLIKARAKLESVSIQAVLESAMRQYIEREAEREKASAYL